MVDSYSHHSPTPTAPGPYILGVDEAGRGPVLGPLVYGVAYCPVAWKDDLDQLGFADSKTLTPEKRAELLDVLNADPVNLGWSVRVISPQAISRGMLKVPPTNLNKQSQDATIQLIRDVLQCGVQLSDVYVDALGNTSSYEAYLSSVFPGINFTVTTKADSKFKIVGAASVAAKVTRDACIEGWSFKELDGDDQIEKGFGRDFGSGYPSDPKTKAWIEESLEKTFGYPSLARFSWTTVKVALEKSAHPVKWCVSLLRRSCFGDLIGYRTDEGQDALVMAFSSAQGRDKDRNLVTRDLCLRSVGTL
ncbi:ribonuclease H-like domain-containing protein [Boletus coccyginus]|nr:ribonuclease H-like domain-containing protein [Boletus coccyginus]